MQLSRKSQESECNMKTWLRQNVVTLLQGLGVNSMSVPDWPHTPGKNEVHPIQAVYRNHIVVWILPSSVSNYMKKYTLLMCDSLSYFWVVVVTLRHPIDQVITVDPFLYCSRKSVQTTAHTVSLSLNSTQPSELFKHTNRLTFLFLPRSTYASKYSRYSPVFRLQLPAGASYVSIARLRLPTKTFSSGAIPPSAPACIVPTFSCRH